MKNVLLRIQCHYRDCDDAVIGEVDGVLNQSREVISSLLDGTDVSFAIHKEISDQREGEAKNEAELDGVVRLSAEEIQTLLNVLKIAQTLFEQHTKPFDTAANGSTNALDIAALIEHDKNFLPLLVGMRHALEEKVGTAS